MRVVTKSNLNQAERPGGLRSGLWKSRLGFTLVELMVSVGIIAVGLFATMSAISYMEFQNRASSQRMLAASIAMEFLELFKALPFAQITNSTTGSPIYLKQLAAGGGSANWQVPAANAWQAIPVEDVASTSSADPILVADKLPAGVWTVAFTPDTTDATLVKVTVTLQWKLYASPKRQPITYAVSTIISKYGPNL